MRKSSFILGAAITLAALAAYTSYSIGGSRPEYVGLAEKGANNILQATYGPGKCLSNQEVDGGWVMNCSYNHGANVATYSVLPPENAPYAIYGNFYLEARNQFAIDSAHKGLGRFLEVGTAGGHAA
ncbi:hypothetical protein AAH446_05940 [Erwinia sp. P6884]|uniref:hypothetical protein n=1 Tax=Erwinia sp. P6884 TaxID=3141450 RepID=UPI00319AA421